ncbi:methionine--tRNA ligase [Malassezia cuniculi]|uniref:methionine--tRNA ligase n=1 Tax=Malassezia cuniculi TaxID=948313 RepID=A0AAF0EW42_9BASI|nr:methionine--tRNA ligase [Malassezia cuniculi]
MASPFPKVPQAVDGLARCVHDAPHVLMKVNSDTHPERSLPRDGEKNILVTSALPYVNNVPHLGNIIGSTLSADVFARYSRTRNWNTLYICGTDEYGTATETRALELNISPKELCDKYHALHAQVYEWFQIGFDHFGRTTTPQQTEITQDIFLKLYNNGYMEERNMTQLHCEKDGRFLADRYVSGVCPKCGYDDARGDQCDKCGQLYDAVELVSPRCKLCGSTPQLRESRHQFVKIDKLQPITEKWASEQSKKGHWSSNGALITESWFREGLRPFAVTRDLKWGVPVPLDGFRDKVFYVWFDAPIGYPSITANYSQDWEKWWKNPENVRLYQFMGKDNVRFHTVIFPSLLHGSGDKWTLLHHINTTEYLQYEGGKFSKSRSIGVFGDKASEVGVSPSVWRYYLLATRPESSDSQFVWADFVTRNNSELLKNLGNFCNRVLTFMKKYDGVVPPIHTHLGVRAGTEGPVDTDNVDAPGFAGLVARFARDVNAIMAQYTSFMDDGKLRAGLNTMMSLSARGNLLLSEAGLDNTLFGEHREECDTLILVAVNLIWTLTAFVHPFMPQTSDEMLAQLNAPPRAVPEAFSIDLLPGHHVGKAAHLFKPIDEKLALKWRAQFGGDSSAEPEKPQMSKKAAAKARKQAEAEAKARMPRTPEVLKLEEEVAAQGKVVREAKARSAPADEVDREVARLLELKESLTRAVDAALAEETAKVAV